MNIFDEEDELRQPNLLLCYGTSTGTAREVALRLAREAYSFANETGFHYFVPEVSRMSDVKLAKLKKWCRDDLFVIFIVSTTGQGEFPEDTKKLWAELCKVNVEPMEMRYAVIGLGDSSYELYNFPGKKLHRRLQQLGGIVEFDLVLCDDQHDLGYAGAFNPFLDKLWEKYVPESFQFRNQNPVPHLKVSDLNTVLEHVAKMDDDNPTITIIKSSEFVSRVPVTLNERVTAFNHFQDTRHIAFDISKSDGKLKFEAGDAVMIYPENSMENAQKFFDIYPNLRDQPPFYLIADRYMTWENLPTEFFEVVGAQPWTWEKVVTKVLDLQSIPGVYAFEILAHFTEDPLIKEKCEEYTKPEGLEDLYNYVNRPRRTILEVLVDFHEAARSVPPDFIFNLIPFLRPRAFSICSPPKDTSKIEILVAVVEYKTSLKKMRRGTCSYWLAKECKVGQEVAVYIQKGSLRAPLVNAHMLMIGPGTGVAPFRSMIMQNPESCDKHLLVGFRNPNKDFYYKKEWEVLVEEKNLTLHTAFSRDDDGNKLDYVQDVIRRKKDLVKELLVSPLPLYIYVCGRSGDMPKAVFNAIKDTLTEAGVKFAGQMLETMIRSGHYQTETY